MFACFLYLVFVCIYIVSWLSAANFVAPYWDMVAPNLGCTTIRSCCLFFFLTLYLRTVTLRGCFRLKELRIVVILSKLATLRRKNQQNSIRKRNLKSNRPCSRTAATQHLSIDTKKCLKISWDYPFMVRLCSSPTLRSSSGLTTKSGARSCELSVC
jgi:hypothetical protein